MFFRPDTNDSSVYSSVYNKNEYNIGYFKETDVVVDVGGHIGSFSLRAWDNNSREIYCYEPYEHNFETLKLNTEHTSIHCYQKAVRGNYKRKMISMDIGDNIKEQEIKNYGGISIREGATVTVITLEDIVKSINKPIKLLKLDCEGSEFSIIMESPDYIFQKIDYIVGEIHSGSLPIHKVNDSVVTHEQFINRLKSLGYITSYRLVSEECQLGFFYAIKNNK